MAAWSFWRAFIEKNVIDSLAVRLYHVYGPGQARGLIPAAMQAAYRNETFRMTPGEQLRDFVYIDDVVDGLAATLTSPEVHGKTYDMGSGVGHQVKAVVHRIFDLMNSRGQYVPGTLGYRPREEMELIAEPATAQIDLNWSAKVPFEEGLVTTVESYRQQIRSL
jgi:nucleoside-diphosphate-sugar epimerase